MHRIGGRGRQLGVKLRLLLQTLDLRTQVLDLLGHLVVLLHRIGGYKAVLPAVLLQECLGLLPEGIALASQFKNLTHRHFLHKKCDFGYKKSRICLFQAFALLQTLQLFL